MSKHTQGQWQASPLNEPEWVVVSGNWGIATCAGYPGDGSTEANARLIAAAPELLDALTKLIAAYERDSAVFRPWLEPVSVSARAAIAKATGEPA